MNTGTDDMGGAVRVLPDDLVNQIAAGEVIERPASIVKELVENALDAEAGRIEVAIAGGGIRWIQVQDDGYGMSCEDAERAFQRHATSKIVSPEDLARVETLGFRGEALPSIASVGSVRMRTRRAQDSVGTELTGEGGGIQRVEPVACVAGTRIEVSELFARVPARRKFLKSPVTEGTQIVRALERIALARPDVHFSLERDGKGVLLFAPTADPRERAMAVLPTAIEGRLVPVQGAIGTAQLFGHCTPTDVLRGTTGDIHLLVNARPVRDRFLLHAVRQAYHDALPPGRHPAAVLYLNVEPGEVDVNVHPSKAEVRFRDPGAIGSLLRESLRQAIGRPRRVSVGYSAPVHDPMPTRGQGREPQPLADLWLQQAAPAEPFAETPPVVSGVDDSRPPAPFAHYRFMGQALGTYLVLEGESDLLLLDQHAAHERVLFERLRQTLIDGKVERQDLLLPIRVELPRSAADALEQHRELLDGAGFDVDVADIGARGQVNVALRSVPGVLADRDRADWQELLSETAAALRDGDATGARDGLEGAVHGVLATAACHAAVRQGDRMEPEEVQGLLEALDETVWFPNCPHGRPIASVVPRAELERRFRRQ